MNGACVGTPYNCLACETHDGSGCQIKSGYCIIEFGGQKTCVAKNQYKPGNPCQVGEKIIQQCASWILLNELIFLSCQVYIAYNFYIIIIMSLHPFIKKNVHVVSDVCVVQYVGGI